MPFTRRFLMVLGTLAALAMAAAATPARAESADEAAVAQASDALRQAMLAADKAKLTELTADQLSYGHSGGNIQSKAQFIEVIADKKTVYKSIVLTEPTAVVVGSNAIVRHVFSAETESGGKPNTSKVGVLQVWTKQDGHWKLLARQAFKV